MLLSVMAVQPVEWLLTVSYSLCAKNICIGNAPAPTFTNHMLMNYYLKTIRMYMCI